jgi:hypothetical protein
MEKLKSQIEFLKKKRKNLYGNNEFINKKELLNKNNNNEQLNENIEQNEALINNNNNNNNIKEIENEKSFLTKKNDYNIKDFDIEKNLIFNKENTFINENNSNKYKISFDPKKIIKEYNEHDVHKRIIESENYSIDFKCNELYNWFHLIFIEWEKTLNESLKNLNPKTKPEIRMNFGLYKQSRGFIKPLFDLLLNKNFEKKDILDKLFKIMVFCEDRDYKNANDEYIELSIGNAPWPLGVNMVGIHERSERAKIFSDQIANILNDDITKKYLLCVKRIISFIQKKHPKNPSECVL